MRYLAALLFLLMGIAHAESLDPYPFQRPADATRFNALTREIRCVVCQNQNIADSNAPLANDLREKVYQMVQEDRTNQEIKAYLVKRYGQFILLRPQFNYLTAALWLFPLMTLAVAFFILRQMIKR